MKFVLVIILNYSLIRKSFSSALHQGTSLTCNEPCDSFKEPNFSTRNPSNHFFTKWRVNSMVGYKCKQGYRFPDGKIDKYSTCLLSQRNTPQWFPNEYYDCIPYCTHCLNGGLCSVSYHDIKNMSSLYYGCKCSENFVGENCEKSVCKAPYVPNSKSVILKGGEWGHQYNVFTVGSMISYTCKNGYVINGQNTLKCASDGLFQPFPPTCENRYPSNIKNCSNEYRDAKESKNHLLSESEVRSHAAFYPLKEQYANGDKVKFKCPPGKFVEGAPVANTGESVCRDNGVWSNQWVMCKAKTCPKPIVQNGVVLSTSDVHIVDSVINIKCLRGYFIYESEPTLFVCMNYGYWNKQIPDCITIGVYKNKCLLNAKRLKIHTQTGLPYCSKEQKEESSQNQLNTITIVTASAAACFGVLLIIVILVVLHRRRLIQRIRLAALHHENEYGNRQFGAYEAAIHFMLPTYEEALKSKPTSAPPTFEEVLQETNPESPDLASTSSHDPSPEYSDASVTTMTEYLIDDSPPPYPGDSS